MITNLFALLFTAVSASSNADSLLQINADRLNANLQTLSKFGSQPEKGTSRVAYSDADKAGRQWVLGEMTRGGLSPSIDAAGNIVATLAGSDPNLKPIATGSHIDTVPQGGNFDGIVGSLSALEVARTLHESRKRLKHPLRIILFSNEEGGHTGSRALTSGLSEDDLQFKSLSGKTVEEGIRFIGGNPDQLNAAKLSPGEFAAFVELHVEQGGILEEKKKQIGIVQGIVGIKRWMITFEGIQNHAGSTPMHLRKDALLGASEFVLKSQELALALGTSQVATSGKLDVTPNAPNVIAGKAVVSFETRDLHADNIARLGNQVLSLAKKIAKKRRLTVQADLVYDTAPVLTDRAIANAAESNAKRMGFSTLRLPSGAGHDAQEMARIAPMGMIFIPSRAGVSHHKDEFTQPGDVARGAQLLLQTLLELDRTPL